MAGMGRVQIGTVMRGLVESCIDSKTGQVNCTLLAELTAAWSRRFYGICG